MADIRVEARATNPLIHLTSDRWPPPSRPPKGATSSACATARPI